MEGDWTTRYKVYPGQLNRPKGVEKLHCIKTKPVFLKPSQTGGPEPFDFPTKISWVSHVNSKHPCILCQFHSDKVSIPIYILLKLCCLILFWKHQNTCCCPWSEVCMILAFFPYPICLFSYLQLFTSNSRWLELFYFSRRFNLARVDCSNGASCSKGG